MLMVALSGAETVKPFGIVTSAKLVGTPLLQVDGTSHGPLATAVVANDTTSR